MPTLRPAARVRRSVLAWRQLACLSLALAPWAVPSATAAEAGPRGPTAAARSAAAVELEGRVIVKYRSGSTLLQSASGTAAAASASGESGSLRTLRGAATLQTRLGLALSDGRTLAPRMQVLRTAATDSASLARRLAAQSDVEWAVPDRRRFAQTAPNDPLYGDNLSGVTPVAGQWFLRAPTTERRSALDAETAWAVTRGSSGLVVAVLDTGVRRDHPDLSGQLLTGYDFISDAGTANDGSGRDADPSDPGDWITEAENRSGTFQGCGAGDSSWHGTQVAGLVAAAADNNLGGTGVAPGVRVLPVRVLGKCGGYDSDIIAGMRWAAGLSVSGVGTNASPAKVLNLSLGGSGSCGSAYQEVFQALATAGVSVVVAAGNDGDAVGVPANCPGAIAVAGVRHFGTKVGYSNLGPEVTVAAPAGNCVNETGTCLYPIVSTSNDGTTVPGNAIYTDGDSHAAVGTSFAAPLVAGTVALMRSANPALTPTQVVTLLQATARTFPSSGAAADVAACHAPTGTLQDSECYCTTSTCGAGLMDSGAAVQQAAASALVAPTASIQTSATTVVAGASLSLSGTASSVGSGRSVATWAWAVAEGASLAHFSGATDQATATLVGDGAGTVTVRLTVTDDLGQSGSATQTVTVQAASSGGGSGGSTSGSSSSGGGALQGLWALALGLAGLALRRRP